MEHGDVLERIARLLSEANSEARKHDFRTLSYFIDMALVQAQDDIGKAVQSRNGKGKIASGNCC